MAVDNDRRQLWNNLVAPVLLGRWYPHNGGRMAHEPERPPVGATFLFGRGVALVYHVGSFCFDCARCTVLQQMDADSSAYDRNCNRSTFGVRATRACATSAVGVPPSSLQPLLAAGATTSRRGVRALPPGRQARGTCYCLNLAVPLRA